MSDNASTLDGKAVNARPAKKNEKAAPGFFARFLIFIREIFAELRVSRRPTRQEWWQLVLVVLVFVTIVMIYVGVLDVVFAKAITLIFG